jgi:hypothetical protein
MNKNISQTLSFSQAFAVLLPDMLHDDQRYGGKVIFSSIYVTMRKSQNVLTRISIGAIGVYLFSIA